jgi:glycosyltransferase involved in cell wall biosynthesis
MMNTPSMTPRIMHVITGLGAGGAESMLTALALAKAKDGPAPIVVSLTPGGPNVARLLDDGVPVHQLGMRGAFSGGQGVFTLAGLIRRLAPDVVQGWMYHANLAASAAVALSGRRRQTKVYWGIRCSDMNLSDYGLALRLVVRMGGWSSRRPDAIIANSAAGVVVHRALGYTPRHFLLIDNGVDTDRFKSSSADRTAVRAELGLGQDDFVVAVAARYDPMKDYPTLLAALEQIPSARAIIMGAGTPVALRESTQLRVLGRHDNVPRMLRAADVLVSSSAYGEGFSNAIAEGMATGLPVAATDVGDARRIVGGAGRIVPPRDPDALAAALRDLEALPERAALGAAARRRMVDLFALDRAIEKFDILHRLGPDAPDLQVLADDP